MAVVTQVSSLTYPGFPEISKYIKDCGIPGYLDSNSRNINLGDSSLWFHDSGESAMTYAGFGRTRVADNDSEMTRILNYPSFRFFHNLLPAGTDVVTAFCQIMTLRYQKKLGLSNHSGTYRIVFNVWTDVNFNKNEAQLSQDAMFSYSVGSKSKKDFPAFICLTNN